MEAEERTSLEDRSIGLRLELKAWEKEFAASNGGQKPGRDVIKQHPTIAQKYRDFQNIRDILSGKEQQVRLSSPAKQTRKRKQDASPGLPPSKRTQTARTPSKPTSHPANIDPYDSPSIIRKLFTPSKTRPIGPTPQKDGQALGLFDLLPPEDEESPFKVQQAGRTKLDMTHATPSKPKSTGDDFLDALRHSRTPASSGKRFLLDSFATPLKRRNPNEQVGLTPSSASKLHFSTPSFLRRDQQRTGLAPIHESGDPLTLSPDPIRLPRKPLVRGLSSMLAGLRKMEEDAADEDLDALHDMERDEAVATSGAKPTPAGTNILQVENSQVQPLLGGFDDEAMYDSEPEELKKPQLGSNGLPLKIWKKKGQKRSTRRVNMKPVRSKPSAQPQSQLSPADSDEELAQDGTADSVAETQQPLPEESSLFEDVRNFDSDSGSEYTASEGGTRYRRPDQGKKKKKKTMGADGKVVSAVRKVGAMAHANFKRLKLRNSGAKGGVAHNSRFRRKR